MQTILIPLLVFLSVACLGGSIVLVMLGRRQLIRQRLGQMQMQQSMAGARPDTGSNFKKMLSRLGTVTSGRQASDNLRRRLAQAGYRSQSAPMIFLGLKFTLFIVAIVGFLAIYLMLPAPSMTQIFLLLLGVLAVTWLPNFFLSIQHGKRTSMVRNHLPDTIDMLEVCVSAGMGLDQAWNAVTDEIRQVSPVLADEMALTNLECSLGVERTQAMRHMAERTGADEIGSLVAVLMQSERFGTSISEALRTFAVFMRELRSLRAEERAARMSVELLFPMVLMIFPAIFVVTAGPAGISIYNHLFN